MFFGYVLNGLAAGGGYALVGVGLSYTIGTARVFNFAYGTFYMLGISLLAFFTGGALSGGYLVAVLLMLAVLVAVAIVFARVSVLPVIRSTESAVMISTLAAGLLLTNVALLVFGSQVRYIDSFLQDAVFEIGGGRITAQAVVALVAAPVATFLLLTFMKRTRTGSRIRATAQNPTLAEATGIHTNTSFLIAVVIGVFLAGLAGALYGPTSVVDVFVGDSILLKAFTVAALAGMGRLWGAVIIGIAMGIAESIFSGYASPAYAEAFIFGLLILTLLLFPKGVFKGE